MSIIIKNEEEINKMRIAGKIAAETLRFIKPYVKAGVSTDDLNTLCHNFILAQKAIPAPLNYLGFPKSICTSLNEVVCHGIPSKKEILKNGDIINIDITVIKDGYHGDTSQMFTIGEVSEKARLLINRTYQAMMKSISIIKPQIFLNDIGRAIQTYIKPFNYGIVRDYTGHGIGKNFHEDPLVCHYDTGALGVKLKPGMIFTVEPMINASSNHLTITDKKDKWTVRTKDRALSAQFEHTVLVTNQAYEILTI